MILVKRPRALDGSPLQKKQYEWQCLVLSDYQISNAGNKAYLHSSGYFLQTAVITDLGRKPDNNFAQFFGDLIFKNWEKSEYYEFLAFLRASGVRYN